MTLDTFKAAPLFTSIAANLYVRDLEASIAFFTGKLEFAIDFVYGEPSFYAQVSRDNARLALRSVDEPVFVAGVREREELLSASITLPGVGEMERLFAAFEAVGVRFTR